MTDRGRRRDERRRKRRERAENASDAAEAAGESGCSRPGCDRGGRRGGSGSDGCGDCDGPGCGCDLLFVRLSTVLALAAALAPAAGADRAVLVLIRGYRRWLTRYTPTCPATPSCSSYALAAVRGHGARRGLAAAARRVAGCRG